MGTWRNGYSPIVWHQRQLDAHTRNLYEQMRVGDYLFPMPIQTYTSFAIIAATLYTIPFLVARDVTLDRLRINITVAGAGGTLARLGIYADDGTIRPGNLVLDAGTVAVDAVAEVEIAIAQALTPGLYWLALLSDGIPTLGAFSIAWSPFQRIGSNYNMGGRYTVAQAFGALPDPAPAPTAGNQTGISILVRYSSMDV